MKNYASAAPYNNVHIQLTNLAFVYA